MSKKTLIAIVCGVVLLGGILVFIKFNNMFLEEVDSNIQEDRSDLNIIEKNVLDYKKLYADVIDKYKIVIKEGDSFNIPSDIAFTVYNDLELNGKFSYALHDIENNGIPEMIIYDDKDYIVGLYAIDTKNQKAVRLFADYYDEDYFCGRSSLTIFTNGYLTIAGSGGATVHSYSQYKIDDTGYKVKLVYSSEENLEIPTVFAVGKKVNLDNVLPINLESLSWTVFANEE